MKKVKIVFWVIVLVLVVVFGYQNWEFFSAKQSFVFEIPFLKKGWHTPELPHAVVFLVFFLTGFLIAYFFSLFERFKSKKAIKNLNAATTSQLEELAALKSELESFRRASSGGSTASEPQGTQQNV